MKNHNKERDTRAKLNLLARFFKQIIRIVDGLETGQSIDPGPRFAPLEEAEIHFGPWAPDAGDHEFHLPAAQDKIIVMGASFGGVPALTSILEKFPERCPPTLIVQHMPAAAMRAFATRLNKECRPEVRIARAGDAPRPGLVLVAPGDAHMVLRQGPQGLTIRLFEGMPVHNQRPSVDMLFHSAAKAAGENAVGILLTGMGEDGALGLSQLRRAGAHTIAQDRATAAMHGMPGAAIALGAASRVLPLERIAPAALALARGIISPAQRLIPIPADATRRFAAAN